MIVVLCSFILVESTGTRAKAIPIRRAQHVNITDSSDDTTIRKDKTQLNTGQKNLTWQWDRNYYTGAVFGGTNPIVISDGDASFSRTFVIVQDSAPGPEVEVLETTSRVNRAYAKRWGYDYLRMTGIALGTRATFNRPYLLHSLLENNDKEEGEGSSTNDDTSNNSEEESGSIGCDQKYDTVMFLHSSAIITDLDYDVLKLLSQNKMLASGISSEMLHHNSSPVFVLKEQNTDVQIWDMNHPFTQNVSDVWIEKSESNLANNKIDSQRLLVDIIKEEISDGKDNLLDTIPKLYIDGLQGTLIKQDNVYSQIDEADLPKMMPVIQNIADYVCYRFYPQCEVV